MRCPAQWTPVSSCLGGPFLFPSSSEEEKSLFWLLALRQDLCEGGQGRGEGSGDCHCCVCPCDRQDLEGAAAFKLSVCNWSPSASRQQLKFACAELQQFCQILPFFYFFLFCLLPSCRSVSCQEGWALAFLRFGSLHVLRKLLPWLCPWLVSI